MRISYATKVKLLKITLISIIVSIILLFLIAPIVYLKLRSNGHIFAANMLYSFLKKDTIPPVFSGTTKNGGAYYLSADKVTNNLLHLNDNEDSVIQVTKPSLMYNTNKNGVIFSLLSNEGIIDTNKHLINLPGKVSVTSNHDFKATLSEVFINLQNSTLESHKPLTALFDNKQLNSNGIKINQTDNTIILKGPVEIKPLNRINKNNPQLNK